MAPKSTAERCKKYRQKHKEVYREKDALRKRNYRQWLTKKGYQFSERKKQKYWQRIKESIGTATASNLVTEQNDVSASSQAHIRSKNIQKDAKTLPKSPRKRKEVISALANKFKPRIQPTQSKTGRPKNELAKSEKEWLQNFLDKPDIRYVTGQKITVKLGKLMVKASMSRNDILCGQSMIYKISQTEVL